jgi:RNA polymerase sigma-70 factor, ECF subfamily
LIVSVPAISVNPLRPTPALRIEPSGALSGEGQIQRLSSRMARLEDDAFREFHATYVDRLLRYLFVVTGDEQIARDALQETFVRIARHVRRFDTEEAFWSWLTVLARSAATDIARKRNRYWCLLNSYALNWLSRIDAEPPDNETEQQLVARIEEGLAALPDQDRQLVCGKYLEGHSVRTLAQMYGLSEKSVEARLRRIRLQLRAELLRRSKNES